MNIVIKLTFLDNADIAAMIHNPAHIIDINGAFTASSFIPFCALAGNMEILGQKVENFKLPVCSKFKPKYLFGHLCYQLDVNDVKNQVKVTNGVHGGITFALDYNEDRRIGDRNEQEAKLKSDQKGLGGYETITDSRFKAKIYIECIEPYTGHHEMFQSLMSQFGKGGASLWLFVICAG